MALAGDLKDIQLPNLIQMLCSRRSSSAIFFEHGDELGSVYIRDGELIDAAAGSARGEDAVFQLLRWREATFRVVEAPRPPRRSVELDWRQLLLEGVRKIDEDQREADIEDAFVALLSALEQVQVKLRGTKVRQRSRKALRYCVELVHRTLDFCESTPQLGLDRERLAGVLAESAPAGSLAPLFEPVEGRLSVDRMETFLRSSSNGAIASDRLALCGALLDALERCLELIVDHFVSPDLRQLWAQTCVQLVQELRGNFAARGS